MFSGNNRRTSVEHYQDMPSENWLISRSGGPIMNVAHRKQLEVAGVRGGTVAEFLNLTPHEERYVNIKATLALEVFSRRKGRQLTQTELAKQAGTSQSRIAKLEAGDPSVSFDLLIRVLIVLDTPEKVIAAPLLGKQSLRMK